MPSIIETAPTTDVQVEFVASPALDLLNAMYFTHLAQDMEGLDEWPRRTRAAMAPELRDELDFLFTYPEHQAGLLGALNDALFLYAPHVATIDDVLAYVRSLPARAEGARGASIEGLVIDALHSCYANPVDLPAGISPREELRLTLATAARFPDDDAHPPAVEITPADALALFDRPEELRARMIAVLRRFYDEHYRPDEARRLARMQASVERHRGETLRPPDDIEAYIARIAGSNRSCVKGDIAGYRRFIFAPSTDVGPYASTIDRPPLLAMYYGCERVDAAGTATEDVDAQRLVLVYKALADEQRLRILRLLGSGERYAQEVVEATGIHQSVVSRHLSFMKAVGLLNVRRQNNMKFYSINGEMRSELRQSLDAVLRSD